MKRRVKENEIAHKKTRPFLVCHENGTSKLVKHSLTSADVVATLKLEIMFSHGENKIW